MVEKAGCKRCQTIVVGYYVGSFIDGENQNDKKNTIR